MMNTREGLQHFHARRAVEFYLKAKGRKVMENNHILFGKQFVDSQKFSKTKRYQGHSYDIWTNEEIIEIDDLSKHGKKNQKINDGIATEFATKHLSKWKFYRLLKEEIVDRRGYLQPTAAEYLREHLF